MWSSLNPHLNAAPRCPDVPERHTLAGYAWIRFKSEVGRHQLRDIHELRRLNGFSRKRTDLLGHFNPVRSSEHHLYLVRGAIIN